MIDSRARELLASLHEIPGCGGGRLGARLQSLWSGYGSIYRFYPGEGQRSLIVKFVCPPEAHPKSLRSAEETGHRRKLKSYDVELEFYRGAMLRPDDGCRIARPLHLAKTESGWLFLLEDLDGAGFSGRRSSLNDAELSACLKWLAEFHAMHLGLFPEGLWEQGTYWHLETRPDELTAMNHDRLKRAAKTIDEELHRCAFQTWVHGDAKVENFCFSKDRGVAAVDFQYVGGGVGVKDVAYFLSSCLDERKCLKEAERWVNEYFVFLKESLEARRPEVDRAQVISEWRRLYRFAWVDFVRFLLGWAPEHFKLTGYSQKLTEEVLRELGL